MTHVNVISQRTKIPTESLMEIINLISTDKGSYKLFGEVFSVKNIDVSIPKDVPLDDRDKLVMEAWSMLYDLLLEALCLIVMMGTVEYTRLLYYLRYQPEEFFSHLLATAVYPDQEDRITAFQTPDDLSRYIYGDLHIYAEFFLIFQTYIQTRYQVKAIKYYPLTKTSFIFGIKPHLQDNIDPKFYADLLHEELLENIEPGDGNLDGDDMDRTESDGTESDGTESDGNQPDTASEHSFIEPIPGETLNRPRKEKREANRDQEDFIREIATGGTEKILKGLFSNYKLRGNTIILMGYLGTVLKKVSLSAMDVRQDEILKDQYQLNKRTLRRYKKEFKLGKVQTSADVRFRDLELEHIEEIKTEMFRRKQHRQEGYLTQRQLIDILRSDDFIRRFCTHIKQIFQQKPLERNTGVIPVQNQYLSHSIKKAKELSKSHGRGDAKSFVHIRRYCKKQQKVITSIS